MLTRRSLFARLSAVALAPLVKWVPKAEGAGHIYYTTANTVVPLQPGADTWVFTRDGTFIVNDGVIKAVVDDEVMHGQGVTCPESH